MKKDLQELFKNIQQFEEKQNVSGEESKLSIDGPNSDESNLTINAGDMASVIGMPVVITITTDSELRDLKSINKIGSKK